MVQPASTTASRGQIGIAHYVTNGQVGQAQITTSITMLLLVERMVDHAVLNDVLSAYGIRDGQMMLKVALFPFRTLL
jgi:hypothetical protein